MLSLVLKFAVSVESVIYVCAFIAFLIVAIEPQLFITFLRIYTAISLLPGDIHLDLHESIMRLYIYSLFTEESSYSVWGSSFRRACKVSHELTCPVVVQNEAASGTGRLKRYHTSSDCILGTMGSALIQGPDFHFNFLLSGVDVCGESLHSLALHRPVPSSHHLLAWNPGDLVSPRALTPHLLSPRAKRSGALWDGPQTPGHYTYLNPAHFNLVWTLHLGPISSCWLNFTFPLPWRRMQGWMMKCHLKVGYWWLHEDESIQYI